MDWVATLCGLTGCFLVANGKRYGWLLYASASAINAYIGLHSGYFGMAVGGICYLILELRGWKKHENVR